MSITESDHYPFVGNVEMWEHIWVPGWAFVVNPVNRKFYIRKHEVYSPDEYGTAAIMLKRVPDGFMLVKGRSLFNRWKPQFQRINPDLEVGFTVRFIPILNA